MAYRKSALTPRKSESVSHGHSAPIDLGSTSVERYPPPAYAAQVWWTADGLRVALPASSSDIGHSVLLPWKDKSLWVLGDLLRTRQDYSARAQRASIGTRASPVQYDIEKILLAMGKVSAKVASHRTSLGDLGLDD